MRAADFLIGKPGPGSIAEAMISGLPVIVECNASTLPQERYNTDWIREKQVGTVVRNFRAIVPAVQLFLQGGKLAELRHNVASLQNRAVFEIADFLATLLQAQNESGARESAPIAAKVSR